MAFILRRSGQQVDVPKSIVAGKQGVKAIQQGLELAGHLVVVDGRGKNQHVGLQRLPAELIRVVMDHTALLFLTHKAAAAEIDGFSAQGDKVHLMPGGFRALGKGQGQRLGIAVFAGTCRYDQNLLHDVSPYFSFSSR